jgi:uncharacterized repeat protein (TIGR02543 family)
LKRLKKELSLLLAFALVLTSLAIGLGQLGTKAADDDMPGTCRFRVGVKIKKNGSKETRGTDSSFQFRLTNNSDVSIGETPVNALWGNPQNGVDPLENNKTTQYNFPGLGYSGNPAVEVPSLGTLNVNKNVTHLKLKCTNYWNNNDDWNFETVWFAYYFEDLSFTDVTGGFGWSGSSLGAEADRTTTFFSSEQKREITFDANGGSGGKTYDIIRGQTIGNSASDWPTVTRTGYSFAGWFPNSDGTGTQLAVGARMGNSNTTYYAKWTPITYTVAYNGNGATGGSTASSSHTYNVAKNLTSNGFTRTGHTFAGWATSPSGVVAYTNGQSVTNLANTQGATVNLYAVWNVNNYNLTFNANGGTGGTGPTPTPYGASISAPAVSRTGYTFTGWSPAVPATMPAADSTYTAQWSINTYYVIFNANGGSGTMSNQGIVYNSSAALTANAFTPPTGHSFAGWNTAANGSGTSYANGATYGPMGASNVSLYAQWSVNNYNLTFDANGGTGGTGPTPTPYGSSISAPSVSRTGYTFSHWSPTVPATMPAANSTYTAQWTPITYTVKYNGNGSTGGSTSDSTHTYDQSKALTLNGFTKTGHTFAGWATSAGGAVVYADGQSVSNLANTQGATVNLYAKWTVNQYTISYQSNGGTPVSSNTVDYGTQISAPTAPTRTGYIFAGWYTDAGLTNAVSWPYTVTANATFYAKWTAITYTVAYNGNGSTGGSTASSSHTYDVSKALTANGFSKTGYTFAGWNTAANGSGTSYSDQQSVQNLTTTNGATINLYAQWTINQYTISFNSNGGSAVTSITQNYGTQASEPTQPTKSGYKFDGWFSDVGLTQAVSWPYTIGASNVTFYAKWTANTYTVAYNANNATGGSVPSSHSHTIGGSNDIATNSGSLVRTGYTFMGWNTKADGTGDNYAAGATNVGDLTTTPSTTVTLYAKWQGNAHTVTFDANGGTGGDAYNLNYGDTLNPPTVRRVGYAFQGWLDSSSNPMPVTVVGDATYYAQWAKTSVSVSAADNDKIAIAITGYSEDYSYQIWSYRLIESDELLNTEEDVPANQWILSMAYTKGSQGDIQNSTLTFLIDTFTSPNENYTIALKIADENGDYIFELRDSYTPEQLGQAVITKVLVDGEYVKGSAQNDGDGHSNNRIVKEIKPSATTTIKVIGNDAVTGYTAEVFETGQTLTVSNGNEFVWDISGLEPRNYSVKVTATNGNSQDVRTIHFALYSTSFDDYVEIDSLTVAGGGVYANPNQNITITPDFTNSLGYFYYKIHEPGRKAQITSGNYTSLDPITQPMTKYGYYQLTGLVNRTSGLLNPSGYDDGIIKFFNMKRDAGASSLTVTTKSGGNPVNIANPIAKGTALRIEGSASIAGIGSTPVEYSFWRYDAKGYILVKDWSSDNFLDWTPGRVGVYNIEVRAKGEDAGSYEVHKSITLTITYTGEPIAEGVNISVEFGSNPVKARVPVVISANATSTNSNDLLYKFYLHDEFMQTRMLQNYSANQECLWTPRKAGTYDILVLVKNQNSYGKYDAVKKVTVNVTN